MSETSPRSVATDEARTPRIVWNVAPLTLVVSHDAGRAPAIDAVGSGDLLLTMPPGLPLVDVLTVGDGHVPASDRLVHTGLGAVLRYADHEETREGDVHRLRVRMRTEDGGVEVALDLEAREGVPVVRSSARVTNVASAEPVVLRSVTSFSTYLGSREDTESVPSWTLHSARSDWLGEGRWQQRALTGELLPPLEEHLTGHNPKGEVRIASKGTWSTGRFLPTAGVSAPEARAAWAWQIEHNGGWRFDLGDDRAGGWFALSGPTDADHAFTRVLGVGESFTSVPVATALASDFTAALGALTDHRRATRLPHPDNAAMPVVFNDYMNTLNGDPTTERLLPLVAAAAEVGAEIFCIDAGWYADGAWWDSVGEWLPSEARFPDGLGAVVKAIRTAGMVPGLWLEPEVIGVNSPMATRLPDEAFLQRHGVRVVEHERFHLDLRSAAAVAHLDGVVDRLVRDFGVSFFKFDYNIDPGTGTDRDADSAGDGLLAHNRAHLAWLDALHARHPSLVIENCGSGAMRSDFAMLSRLQMQSTSDQQDFTRYPPIAAAAPAQMLPEQAASWAYPQADMSAEEAAFCLVTGLLGRFYLSGYLNRMDEDQLALVRESVAVAKRIRGTVAASHAAWPLGMPGWDDSTVALALETPDETLVSVWHRGTDGADVVLPFPGLRGTRPQVDTIFPVRLPSWQTSWDEGRGALRVRVPEGTLGARLLRLTSPRSSD